MISAFFETRGTTHINDAGSQVPNINFNHGLKHTRVCFWDFFAVILRTWCQGLFCDVFWFGHASLPVETVVIVLFQSETCLKFITNQPFRHLCSTGLVRAPKGILGVKWGSIRAIGGPNWDPSREKVVSNESLPMYPSWFDPFCSNARPSGWF